METFEQKNAGSRNCSWRFASELGFSRTTVGQITTSLQLDWKNAWTAQKNCMKILATRTTIFEEQAMENFSSNEEFMDCVRYGLMEIRGVYLKPNPQ